MIKVLEKTFGILEMVTVSSPEPVLPGKLASALELNRPTCSRILKELCTEGYLKRVSRMSGYTLGPRTRSFADHVNYREDFLFGARKRISSLAEELSESVLLAEKKGPERYILYHLNCNKSLNIKLLQLSWKDLFSTATGMVLTAYDNVPEQKEIYRIYRENGWEIFDDLDSEKSMLAALKKTREEGVYIREKFQTLQWIASVPVFRDGILDSALGVSAPNESMTKRRSDEIVRKMRKCADALTSDLSCVGSIG